MRARLAAWLRARADRLDPQGASVSFGPDGSLVIAVGGLPLAQIAPGRIAPHQITDRRPTTTRSPRP